MSFFEVRWCFAFPFAVAPVELLQGKAFFVLLVVGEDEGFGEADGSRVAVFCGAGNGFGGDEADAVFEGFFVQAVP